MSDFLRYLGQVVHDWGLGAGTVFLGIGAIIAACHTDEILDKILSVQKTSNGIEETVTQMKKSGDELKKVVDEITKILSHINEALMNSTAKNTVASLPANATTEQIQRSLSSLVKPPSSSEPYLTEKSMFEVLKAWEVIQEPKSREEILYRALRISPESKSYE